MTATPGVVLARPDGLTHVPNGIPVAPEVVRLLNDLYDRLTQAATEPDDTDRQEPA